MKLMCVTQNVNDFTQHFLPRDAL